MKVLLLSLVLTLSLSFISAEAVTNGMPPAKGFVNTNKTHIQPPNRTIPNKIKMGNDSTKRNINHSTFVKGPQDPHQHYFHKP